MLFSSFPLFQLSLSIFSFFVHPTIFVHLTIKPSPNVFPHRSSLCFSSRFTFIIALSQVFPRSSFCFSSLFTFTLVLSQICPQIILAIFISFHFITFVFFITFHFHSLFFLKHFWVYQLSCFFFPRNQRPSRSMVFQQEALARLFCLPTLLQYPFM